MKAYGDPANAKAASAGTRAALARAFLVCALCVACTPPSAAPAVRSKSPPSATADQSQSWRVVRVPLASSWANFVDSTSATTRVLFAGSRAEVSAGAVSFAHDDTLEAMLGSCPSDGGFLHFTEGGGLFWSQTFLGRLQSVGRTRSDLYQRIVQCNPVVALSSSGRPTLLVSRSGSRLLGQGDLALVHFRTTKRARAVAAPDRLLETTDGGRTFAALSVRPSADLDEPTAWLGTEFDVLDQADETLEYAQGEADPVRAAWVRRAVATEAGKVAGGLVLADGTWVRWVHTANGAKVLLAFRTPDGRITDHSIPGSCSVQPYGTQLLVACSPPSLTLSLLGPGGESALPEPPHPVRVVAADPKGHRIAALGVANDPATSAGNPMLVIFDGVAWREYPGLDVTPLAATSNWLLVQHNPHGSPALLSLIAPESTAFDFGKEVEESAVSLLEHELAYIRRTGTGTHYRATLIWRDLKTGKEGPAHEISTEIQHVGFADEQHGMAVDSDGGLHITEDGGRSFARVPWQGTRPDPRAELRCWSRGCSFAAAVAFTDEPLTLEPPALPNPEVELPEALIPSEHAYDAVFPLVPVPKTGPSARDRRYRCRATPPLPFPLPGREALGGLRFAVPEHATYDPLNPTSLLVERKGNALAWSSRDAAGAFRVETPALTDVAAQLLPTVFESPRGDTSVAALRPVLLARSYALLVQTHTELGSNRAGHTVYFVLQATGRAKVLAKVPPAQGTRAGLLLARVQAMPLPKDGAAVLVSAPGRQELFELDPTGTVVARRWFVGPGGRMALGPDGLAFVVEDDDSTRVYSMARGSAAHAVTWNTRGAFPDCKRASPAGAHRETHLVAFGAPSLEIERAPPAGPLFLQASAGASLLEIGPAGGCWRSSLASEPFRLELGAEGVTMRGTLIGPERAHSLACHRAKP